MSAWHERRSICTDPKDEAEMREQSRQTLGPYEIEQMETRYQVYYRIVGRDEQGNRSVICKIDNGCIANVEVIASIPQMQDEITRLRAEVAQLKAIIWNGQENDQ